MFIEPWFSNAYEVGLMNKVRALSSSILGSKLQALKHKAETAPILDKWWDDVPDHSVTFRVDIGCGAQAPSKELWPIYIHQGTELSIVDG